MGRFRRGDLGGVGGEGRGVDCLQRQARASRPSGRTGRHGAVEMPAYWGSISDRRRIPGTRVRRHRLRRDDVGDRCVIAHRITSTFAPTSRSRHWPSVVSTGRPDFTPSARQQRSPRERPRALRRRPQRAGDQGVLGGEGDHAERQGRQRGGDSFRGAAVVDGLGGDLGQVHGRDAGAVEHGLDAVATRLPAQEGQQGGGIEDGGLSHCAPPRRGGRGAAPRTRTRRPAPGRRSNPGTGGRPRAGG